MIQVTATGRLGRDPELKETNNGKPMCFLNVGCDEWNSKEKERTTTWFKVTVFGRQAEFIAKAGKGDPVTFTGPALFGIWDSNNGPKIDAECTASEVVLHVKPRSGDSRTESAPEQAPEGYGDNIPF